MSGIETAQDVAAPSGPAEILPVSVLEPALWKQLADANDIAEISAPWLALQCALIGAKRGIVTRIKDGAAPLVIASWPAEAKATDLAPTAAAAAEQRRGVVQQAPTAGLGGPAPVLLGYPVMRRDGVFGAAVIELDGKGVADLRQATRQLQWGIAWLRERLLAETVAENERVKRTSVVALELLGGALDTEGFGAACRSVVTSLAHQFGCERVSIGFLKNDAIRVAEISHTAQFGQNMNAIRLLRNAMEEAVDQRAALLWPASAEAPHVTRAHQDLASAHHSGSVLTIPLFSRDHFTGAITLEHHDATRFNAEAMAVLDGVVSMLGPILETMRRDDRWLIERAADTAKDQARLFFGPGHWGRKLGAGAFVLAAVFAYFATGTYRITGDAEIQGLIQRSVTATFNGFIKSAPARAGDRVAKEQTLAVLDDSDLVLERLRWVTERQRKIFERERALGDRHMADVNIANAEIGEADAELRLVDGELARAQITAPFDGIVVSGDLAQQIGSPVQRGEVLFEVAPLDSYRVVLQIDESQISDIHVGQPGRLVVTALPNETFPLTVTKVTPVADAHDGHNFFRVEASLKGSTPQLRPGMHGVAKLDVDRRRLVWIWGRTFIEWATLFKWRWFG